MNPKWRDYIVGLALFMLVAILICWERAAHSMTPAQQHAIAEAGAISASLPVIRCETQTRVGGIRLPEIARHASRTHCGADFALTLQAVIGQESSYCTKLVNHRDPSYGCGGLTLKTAREVAGRKVTPHELLHDRALNLRLTARYLHALITRYGWARGVCGFNHGPASAKCATGAERDAYVLAIRNRITEVLGRAG